MSLPLGVLAAFVVMRLQGVNANIMSLGGIAIAIGAMVDAAIVMIENAHKKLEAWEHEHGRAPAGDERWQVITDAAVEVGPALFFSLVIITLSFVPVFTLEAQEGRMFAPLAFTKTYAMAAAAGLAVTLVPVLMGYFVRGRIPSEGANPLNRMLIAGYRPLLRAALAWPKATLVVAALALAATAWPVSQLGGEFMPPLDEGDLLYMPTALPGLSAGKAGELLQQTDRLIKTVPEVAVVFGKVGRAETATDPAPMEMIETTIRFKPKEEWRPGMTTAKLIEELDRTVQVPGLSNIWVPPIRNRIDMLATGIKSPVGIKVSGPDPAAIDRVTQAIERAVKGVPGVTSALAERLEGGRYLDIVVDRAAAARFGLNIVELQETIGAAVGGENIGETVEGLARFPISVRYPRELRDSVEALRMLPIVTERGAQLPLSAVATRAHRRRPADAEERERAADGLGLRGRARPRPRVGGPRRAGDGRARGEAAAGLLGVVVRPVRVSRAGEGAARVRRAADAHGDLRAALSRLPAHRRGAAHHARGAVRARRRLLAAVGARLRDVGGHRRRVHRARGRGRGVRRRDAALPSARVGGTARARRAADRRTRCSRRSRRAPCCACGRRR